MEGSLADTNTYEQKKQTNERVIGRPKSELSQGGLENWPSEMATFPSYRKPSDQE